MAPVVVAEHLTKRYGRRLGVDDVSFGRRRAMCSGCSARTGRVRRRFCASWPAICTPARAGRRWRASMSSSRAWRRADASATFPRRSRSIPMRVDEFLAFMGRLKGLDARRLHHAVDASLRAACPRRRPPRRDRQAFPRLSSAGDDRPGSAQRPGAADPDEPTNGLDPRQIIEVRELIRRFAHDDRDVPFLTEIERVATHVAILLQGRLLTVQRLEQGAATRLRLKVRSASTDPFGPASAPCPAWPASYRLPRAPTACTTSSSRLPARRRPRTSPRALLQAASGCSK